jgi:ubiquinone/menaquinone biosynthesis C-methylase UbiE
MPPTPDHRAVYEAAAAEFDRMRDRRLVEAAWLARFRALVPAGAPVLDLGCGAGEPIAAFLLAQGRAVTGLDFAPAMLRLARSRFPAARWIEGDMRVLDLPGRFHGIVAWDSFFHLTAADQRAMFPVFARHLAPGGALLFTSGPDAGEAVGSVEGLPVYHASLTPADYAACLERAGLVARVFIADDPDCDRHSVWLARRRA